MTFYHKLIIMLLNIIVLFYEYLKSNKKNMLKNKKNEN